MKRAPLRMCFAVTLLLLQCLPTLAGQDAGRQRDRARTHLIEARRLAADYQIAKAASKAREALKDDQSLAEAHVYLGLERFRAGDWKGATEAYSRAIEMDQYQAAAHAQLAFVLYQQGQLDLATDHWTLSVRLDDTSAQTLAGLALAQFKNGQREEAFRSYEHALLEDRRFADPGFIGAEKGPKWSDPLLTDFHALQVAASHTNYR